MTNRNKGSEHILGLFCLVGRGFIFHMSETLHPLPCARPLSPSAWCQLHFGVCSLQSLCRCGVIHIGLSQGGTADVSNAGLERGQGERHLLSLACEQHVKFCAVFGSLMKISTYMLIIFLTAVVTTEWLQPFRLECTGCESPCSTAALLSPRTAGNRKANKLN